MTHTLTLTTEQLSIVREALDKAEYRLDEVLEAAANEAVERDDANDEASISDEWNGLVDAVRAAWEA